MVHVHCGVDEQLVSKGTRQKRNILQTDFQSSGIIFDLMQIWVSQELIFITDADFDVTGIHSVMISVWKVRPDTCGRVRLILKPETCVTSRQPKNHFNDTEWSTSKDTD